MERIRKYLFEKRYHFSRFQFNLAALLFAVFGFVFATYFAAIKLPGVFAVNDTTKTWTFNGDTSGQYTYDDTLITVDGSVESGSAHPVAGVNKIANPAFTSGTDSWSVTPVSGSTTPSGWALVPGDSNYVATGSAFLAMQYEAKYNCTGDANGDTAAECQAAGVCTAGDGNCSASSGLGLDYSAIASFNNANVVSSANGAPLVHITQTQAFSSCPVGYHLINNNEWMATVRNAELVSTNWTGGSAGTGCMFAGNNGETTCGYNSSTDPDYGTGRNDRAKLTLSNGSQFYDLSGNVWEWNSDTIMGADKPHNNTGAWVEWTVFAPPGASTYGTLSYLLTRPSVSSYDATKGIGRYYEGSNTGGPYGFLRGGN